MKISIEKCTKFYYMSEVYYHYTDLDGNFIRESNGFYSDKNQRLNDKSKILEIWYTLIVDNKRIPFFESIKEIKDILAKMGANYKQLKIKDYENI